MDDTPAAWRETALQRATARRLMDYDASKGLEPNLALASLANLTTLHDEEETP